MSRLVVAAAEASGDALAARVVEELRRRDPGRSFVGAAGPALRAAGVEPLVRSEGLGVVGVVEALRVLPAARRALRTLEAALPGASACLTFDAPSLWLPLASRARARGVPAVHVVAPQVWAWRPGRVDRVAASVDVLLCLLPFEPAWFEGRVRAVFVGHPAAAVRAIATPADGRPTIALLPGSRAAEIATLWPALREIARRVRARCPSASFVVPRAPTVAASALGGLDARFVASVAACAHADAAVVASGTATLELAALDVPMVVVYRVNPVTAALARRLLTVRWVSLPNLLCGREVVTEHLQHLDPDGIAEQVLGLVGVRGQVPREVVSGLDGEGAVGRIADEVERWLTPSLTSVEPMLARPGGSWAPGGRRRCGPGHIEETAGRKR